MPHACTNVIANLWQVKYAKTFHWSTRGLRCIVYFHIYVYTNNLRSPACARCPLFNINYAKMVDMQNLLVCAKGRR